MITLSVSDILKEVQDAKGRNKQIETLKKYYSPVIHEILAFGYDSRVKWRLPPTDPSYTPLPSDDAKGALFREASRKKLYYFVQGGSGDNLTALKVETMFIQLLETLDPADARLLLSLKNKKIPYKGVTQKLIEDAYGVYT